MASTPVSSNALILEVLNRHNYKNWRSRVKTYLLAEDLWEVIIKEIMEPAQHDDEYKAWTKKNAKALYAIQNSCGPEMFPVIRENEIAKSAWDALERFSKLTGHVQNSADNFKPYIPFKQFVFEGNWVKAKECVRLGELDLHSAVRAIDPRDRFGDMALHVAARKGHVHIVKELVVLMTQEELKMKNAQGATAIHLAAWNGQVHTVKELVLLMGEEKDSHGDTALHVAVYKGKLDIVKVLVLFMRQEDLKIKNNNGYTALHLAVLNGGNVPMVKELGPLMGEASDGAGDTALHLAVKKEQLEIVKELVPLMRREDLAIKNTEGYTALHLAVNKGNVPIVKQFVTKEEGEDDFDRYIPFTTCVFQGDWDKAKECLTEVNDLYDAITRVNPRDGRGDTALHVAAAAGHAHIVKELASLLKVREEDFRAFGSGINLGVNEQVVMERAKYMVDQYEKTIESVLEVQNAEGFTALHLAVLKGNVDIVKELVLLMRQQGLEIKDAHENTPLHLAVQNGNNVDIVKELVQSMRVEGLEVQNNKGGFNALHLAVKMGHMHIVKELMSFMRKEALEEKDGAGYTALGLALVVRKDGEAMEIAKYMAEKNKKVFGMNTPPLNWIPVVTACSMSWDLCHYLYPLTPLEFLMRDHEADGAQLIINCLRAKKLDMALDLLKRCPKLAISPSGNSSSPIMELAGMHSAFLSGTQLEFMQKFIYNRTHIEPADLNIHDTCINIPKQEDDRHNQMDLTCSVIRLYKELVNGVLKLLGVNRLRKMKWIHTRSIDLLRCISEMVKKSNFTSAEFDIVKTSIFKAVEYGHVEFVILMCQAHPPFIKLKNENDRSIFPFAIECRQNKIYSLIHGLDQEDKRLIVSGGTKFPENTLHLAGSLSPLSRFSHIRGAALQMQRELQWFKEVETIVPSEWHEIPNSNGMTPHELFTKNHENLKVEAENSMKGTATSCTVVGALIITIMFAAAFTVPGGNDDSTGSPMFLAEKLFLVFISSDTLSLVFSTTSVILFLGILTSRYAEDDFLKDLPTKMLIGLFTLFLAIATMMIAFSAALIIMLEEKYSWAIIPCIFVACIPVASFIWLQFPLLIEIFMSTYRPGIFDKKVERWVKL